jgi:hypothetical protein
MAPVPKSFMTKEERKGFEKILENKTLSLQERVDQMNAEMLKFLKAHKRIQ